MCERERAAEAALEAVADANRGGLDPSLAVAKNNVLRRVEELEACMTVNDPAEVCPYCCGAWFALSSGLLCAKKLGEVCEAYHTWTGNLPTLSEAIAYYLPVY